MTSMAVSVSRAAAVSRAAEPKPSVHQSGQAWRCTSSLLPCSFSTQARNSCTVERRRWGQAYFSFHTLTRLQAAVEGGELSVK